MDSHTLDLILIFLCLGVVAGIVYAVVWSINKLFSGGKEE